MRRKILYVSSQLILEICKYGTENVRIVKDALPPNAKIVDTFCNDMAGWSRIGLVIEDESFEEVNEGNPIEILIGPTFEKVEK